MNSKSNVFPIACATIAAFYLLTFAAISRAEFAEAWVDQSWTNANPGDPVGGHVFGQDAFAHIQDAVDAVATSGVVQVAAGTYLESVDFGGKDLTLQSEFGAINTIIDGSNSRSSVVTCGGGVLDGFTVQHATGGDNYGLGSGVHASGSAQLLNNVVRDNSGWGILLSSFSGVISNNTVQGSSRSGIYLEYSSPLIINSKLLDSQSIETFGSGDTIGFQITANLIKGGMFLDSFGSTSNIIDEISNNLLNGQINVNLEGSSGLLVRNNTFVGGTIWMQRGGPQTHIINNIFTHCHGAIQSEAVEIRNNDMWLNDIDYYNLTDRTGIDGNMAVNPLFINPAADDYHLSDTSPCIGAGTNNAPSTDFDGHLRADPPGSLPDLGAYENSRGEPAAYDGGAYFGLGVSNVFIYQVRQGKTVSSLRREITSIDYSAKPAPAYTVEDTQDGEIDRTIEPIITNALAITRMESSGHTVEFWDPLVIANNPATLVRHWVVDTYVSYDGGDGLPARLKVSVSKQHKIVVPAGTFNAFPISYQLTIHTSGHKSTVTKWQDWLAPNVGIIQTRMGKQMLKLESFTTN